MEKPYSEAGDRVARGVSLVLAAALAIPESSELAGELACADRAAARGYFLPDEEVFVRVRYRHYLSLRAALLESVEDLAAAAGEGAIDWRGRLPIFVTAFAAACLLMRATRFVIDLAKDRSAVWKKLDEADPALGIPRKTFTGLYKSAAGAINLRRFMAASDFYFEQRQEIAKLAGDPLLGPVVRLLENEEASIERGRRVALKRLAGYRWFSFLRRHRSAWRQVMYGMFKVSGTAIAELRQPGIKSSGAPKRLSESLRAEILAQAMPGDVFVTRHDDALSNLFFPGFWPHAALFLGTAADLRALGMEPPFEDDGRHWFLEAKKDGVRLRAGEETLQVDACLMIRPPLEAAELRSAISRAMAQAGKPFDFLFDFRNAEVVACTGVIYRSFHGVGPVRFQLEEVGGRLCLPAEVMLDQAMNCGFRVLATAGLEGDRVLWNAAAELAFRGSRLPG